MPLAAEDFPKTTSGKIQRSKLKSLVRQGYLHGSLPLLVTSTCRRGKHCRTARLTREPSHEQKLAHSFDACICCRAGLLAICEHDKAQQEGARDTKGKAEGSLPRCFSFPNFTHHLLRMSGVANSRSKPFREQCSSRLEGGGVALPLKGAEQSQPAVVSQDQLVP